MNPSSATPSVLRPHAEHEFAHELAALAAADDRGRPPSWRLSPWAVVAYLLGGVLPDGTVISPKYVGQRRLIEIAVATLATDRALLLLGVPGPAKTWVSEHLAAAISGDSTLPVQATAGPADESLRSGWHSSPLPPEGPSHAAPLPRPRCSPTPPGRSRSQRWQPRTEPAVKAPSAGSVRRTGRDRSDPRPHRGRQLQGGGLTAIRVSACSRHASVVAPRLRPSASSDESPLDPRLHEGRRVGRAQV